MAKIQRQWKSQVQQLALTEFDLIRSTCPNGIYLCLTPGNFALWSGMLFVRKGPYASAVLRFQLAFPQNYPAVPPLIIFTNDIFHPLVTPLTTYTYSTSTSAADPVSAGDQERLLPGGLSLRHGFPGWFKRSGRPGSSDGQPSLQTQSGTRNLSSTGESDRASEEALNSKTAQSIFQPPPKDEGSSVEEAHPTIIEVLRYLKDVFEDESLLDNVPIDAAGNPGAWHAWQAYRQRIKPGKQSADGIRSQSSTPSRGASTRAKPKPGGWNWDGVWAERVKKAVNNSLSESTLYGGVDGDDIIHFLDLGEEASQDLRKPFQSREIGKGQH